MGVKSSQLLESLDLEELDGKVLAAIVEDVKQLEEFKAKSVVPTLMVVSNKEDEKRVKEIMERVDSHWSPGIKVEPEGSIKPKLGRKTLKWNAGGECLLVIRDSDQTAIRLSQDESDAFRSAKYHAETQVQSFTVARVLEPRGDGCPVATVARFEPENCLWGILELQSYRWWAGADSWTPRIGDSIFRFHSKDAAKNQIDSCNWEFDVVPWAFPARSKGKQKGGES